MGKGKAARAGKTRKMYAYSDRRKPAIVFLSIALALFLGLVGFFVWHTVRMRNYESDFVRAEGIVTGVETHHSSTSGHSNRIYYYLEITYSFGGEEFTFVDGTGYNYPVDNRIGTSAEIYVDPQNPQRAEVVSSSDFVSIICACCFAFLCVVYAVGTNFLLSIGKSTFKKRLLFVWGAELLLGIVFLLLYWLGLPNSGFGEVFSRIQGAVGTTVVMGLIVIAASLDGLITYKLQSKRKDNTEATKEILKQ